MGKNQICIREDQEWLSSEVGWYHHQDLSSLPRREKPMIRREQEISWERRYWELYKQTPILKLESDDYSFGKLFHHHRILSQCYQESEKGKTR